MQIVKIDGRWRRSKKDRKEIGKEDLGQWPVIQKGVDRPRRSRACIKGKKWNEKLILVCGQK